MQLVIIHFLLQKFQAYQTLDNSMKKINLWFNEEEMIFFLKKKGFRITEIDSYRCESAYHNDVNIINMKLTIATDTKSPVIENDQIDSYYSKYLLENVFETELRKGLLRL